MSSSYSSSFSMGVNGCSFCGEKAGMMVILGERHACGRCLPKLDVGVPADRVEDLIKLCHPDRHRGPMEALATEATKWLLSLRKKRK